MTNMPNARGYGGGGGIINPTQRPWTVLVLPPEGYRKIAKIHISYKQFDIFQSVACNLVRPARVWPTISREAHKILRGLAPNSFVEPFYAITYIIEFPCKSPKKTLGHFHRKSAYMKNNNKI